MKLKEAIELLPNISCGSVAERNEVIQFLHENGFAALDHTDEQGLTVMIAERKHYFISCNLKCGMYPIIPASEFIQSNS